MKHPFRMGFSTYTLDPGFYPGLLSMVPLGPPKRCRSGATLSPRQTVTLLNSRTAFSTNYLIDLPLTSRSAEFGTELP